MRRELVVLPLQVPEVEPKAGLGVWSAGMFDAVDVVGEVVAKRGLAAVGLPGLLPQEVSVLVARQPLLPGVVNPHDHHVFDLSLTEREVNQEC